MTSTLPKEGLSNQILKTILPGLAFFLSGFAGLAYQVIWIRAFCDIVGSTSQATACIFSAYLLSLSLGGYLISFFKVSSKKSLYLYAILETFIGIFAFLITPWLMTDVSEITQFIAQTRHMGLAATIAADFGVTFIFICLPVMAMGATLPLMANGIPEKAGDRDYTLLLYGINTIGAAIGAASTGFILVKSFGFTNTLAFSMFLNFLAAGIAVFLSSRKNLGLKIEADDQIVEKQTLSTQSEQINISDLPSWLVNLLAFSSGFIVLAIEIYWERAAKFFVGNRIQASSLLLFSVLIGLGVGSIVVKTRPEKFPAINSNKKMAHVFWLNSLIQPVLFAIILTLIKLNLSEQLPYLLLLPIGLATMVLSLVLLGTIFPYLLISLKGLKENTINSIGKALFFNTAGCASGSLFAGFIGARYLGTPLSILLLSASLLVLSLKLSHKDFFSNKQKLASSIAVFVVFALLSSSLSPFVFPADAKVLFKSEDEYGFHSIFMSKGQMYARTNKSYLVAPAGTKKTAWAQQAAAHFPMFFSEKAKDILVIGNGYGITAGTFRLYSEPEKIETVEIMPYMVTELEKFGPYNFAYWQDKRFETLLTDGKSFVELASRTWDIINLNISDPTLEGSAQFYTISALKMLKSKINKGGMLTVLVWGNAINNILKTLHQVFPGLILFPAYSGSYIALCPVDSDIDWQNSIHSDRLTPEALNVFKDFGISNLPQYISDSAKVAIHYSSELKRDALKPEVKIHTIDRPVIEYVVGGGELIFTFNSTMIKQ